MRPESVGLIVGGLIPAIFFAVDALSSKASMRAGMSWAPYILVTGLSVVVVGLIGLLFDGDRKMTSGGAALAALKGLMWSVGCVLVVIGLDRYKAPLAQLAPLYSVNILIAVGASVFLFREEAALDLPRLAVGAILVVVGAAVVASA